MIVEIDSKEHDLADIIARSPVKDAPNAHGIMRDFIARSFEVRYGLIDGLVACIWGLVAPSLLSENAYLWLLTTDIVAEHKFLFVRHSQRYIEDALKFYPKLVGDCMVGDTNAKRWLEWLGAEFGPMIRGRYPFVIQAKAK